MSTTPANVYRQVADFLRSQDAPPTSRGRGRKRGSLFDVANATVGQWGAGHRDDDDGNLNRLAVYNPSSNIPELRPTIDSASFTDELNNSSIEVHWRGVGGAEVFRVAPSIKGMLVTGPGNSQFLNIAVLSQPWIDPRVDVVFDAYDDQETISLIYNATIGNDGTLQSGYRLRYDRISDVAALFRYDAGVATEIGNSPDVSLIGDVFGLSLRHNGGSFIAQVDTGGSLFPVTWGDTPSDSTYTNGLVGVCFEGVDAIVNRVVVRRVAQ